MLPLIKRCYFKLFQKGASSKEEIASLTNYRKLPELFVQLTWQFS